MTRRNPTACLEDILKYSTDVLMVSRNVSKQEFESNIEKQYALCRCIEIIGEATKRLLSADPSFQEKFPEIPWKLMARMRDILIHHYEESDLDKIWNTIQSDIPELHRKIKKIIDQLNIAR